MGDAEQIKKRLTVQLNALEKLWDESTDNSDLRTHQLKLDQPGFRWKYWDIEMSQYLKLGHFSGYNRALGLYWDIEMSQ